MKNGEKRSPPNRAPAKRDAPFLKPSNYVSLKFLDKGLPRFPNGPLRREAPVSRAFFYTFLSSSLVNEPTSMFSNRAPLEREASSPETMVYSFIYVCQSPHYGALPRKTGENIWSPSTEPHTDGRPTYNGVQPGSPSGLLTTLLSLPQCHAALGTIPSTLAWVDQSPVSQHLS
jgi:hypothetical protein